MGVNTGDGRGNITAYAGVCDNEASAAERPRLLGVLAGGEPDAYSSPAAAPDTSYPGYFYGGGQALTVAGTRLRCRTIRTQDRYNFGPVNHYQRPETPLQARRDGSLRVRRTSPTCTRS